MKELIKKFYRLKIKKYDVEKMEDLQRICKALRKHIDGWHDEKTMTINCWGRAHAIASAMTWIQDNYPLEVYITVYTLFETELKEVRNYLEGHIPHDD